MKMKEIKQLNDSELITEIKESKLKLLKMKMNHTISNIESPILIRFMRKDIARMLTELNSRKKNKIN